MSLPRPENETKSGLIDYIQENVTEPNHIPFVDAYINDIQNSDIKKLITHSFVTTQLPNPQDYYSDAIRIGSRTGVITGAIIGGVLGGPLIAAGGAVAGYAVGAVLAGVIKGIYDECIEADFADLGFGIVYGYFKGGLTTIPYVLCVDIDVDKTPKNILNKCLHAYFVKNFVTPSEYIDTVEKGLKSGWAFGDLFTMGLFSSDYGRLGSIVAGAIKGGYDGYLKGGFQKKFVIDVCKDVYEGVLYGAAVGCYHYEKQYHGYSSFQDCVKKAEEGFDNVLQLAVRPLQMILDFIVGKVSALINELDQFSKAYQQFNLFPAASQTNEHPEYVLDTNISDSDTEYSDEEAISLLQMPSNK